MKNKLKLNTLLIITLFFFTTSSIGEEFIFNTSEINITEEGNIIKASNGTVTTPEGDFIIRAKNFNYDKKNLILEAFENVEVNDLKNEILIESDFITYNYKKRSISSNKKSTIKDDLGNIFFLDNFLYTLDNKLIKLGNTKIIDVERNHYKLEKAFLNLKSKKLLGKDISIDFSNKSFQKNNEPRLKGATIISDGKGTTISKGVFTTCKKNDSCPPWVLSSEKIEHNKIKKTITYKNAWLKLYDIPVLYFPRFFHPDPSVRRQSGFLTPQFSQSSNLGNYFSIPYYNAISINSDLTFTPRLYDDGKALYQTEYRNYLNKSEHVLDFSASGKDINIFEGKDKTRSSHFFLKSKFDINLESFNESQIDLKIQQTDNDDYLKTYKIKSPLMQSEETLHSSLILKLYREDLEAEITAETYENLSLPASDRYEYIYPSFKVSKNIGDFTNGSFALTSSGSNKKFNTNTHEGILVNDLNYKSYDKISTLGLVSNYEFLLKNFNLKTKKSTTYNNKTENSLQSILNYEIKYPLKKVGKKYLSTLTPILSARYSPNKSKDKSKNDRYINPDNIFSINRIGFSDTVEGGQSITFGNEFSLQNKDNKDLFSFNIATVLRDTKNTRLPESSTIGRKNSDIFGDINFNVNEFIDLDYNFALDNNFKTSNFNQIKTTLNFYNFISTFDFLERNNITGSESYISNETKLKINKSSSLSFKTRKNKNTDLTEYYNLLYEYKNDCLTAGIEFKKDFYSDGSLRPEEQLFFSITIMPLGKFSSPDINQ